MDESTRIWSRLRVDHLVAHEVASWFIATPAARPDALVAAAYTELQEQTDCLFALITDSNNPVRVRVAFTKCQDPYSDDQELILGVRSEGELEVTTAQKDPSRRHPMFGCECGGPYDRFRAVHDILGHVRLGVGFDRDGEYATWVAQERQYFGLARWALATELHGEHSVCWTTGEPAEHKGILFQLGLLTRARSAGAATSNQGSMSNSQFGR